MNDDTLSYLIWVFYSLPVVILVAYALTKIRRHQKAVNALAEAEAARLTEPVSLHPVFSNHQCIGCGACAAACPEGDVIGLIHGKPKLINPTECIGHGACKAACPVGAITLVFGSETRGVDIPLVSPQFETNVSGIYIAGELGGMGLIRNAVTQGTQAMDAIIKAKRKAQPDEYDVVIIGSGPAGFAATLSAMQAGLRYATLEQETFGGTVAHFPRGKIVMTAAVNLPLAGKLSFREIGKEQLIGIWSKIANRFKMRINTNERMENIEAHNGSFIVTSTKARYKTKAVLLAIGRRGTPRKLGVPGEDLPKVVYRLIDPEQYRGQKVLIVGGGDSALEAAHSIAAQNGTQVTLSYRSGSFSRAKPKNRDKIARAEIDGRLQVLFNSNVVSITDKQVTLDQEGRSVVLENDAIIVNAGGILPTPLLKQIGIEVETKFGTE